MDCGAPADARLYALDRYDTKRAARLLLHPALPGIKTLIVLQKMPALKASRGALETVCAARKVAFVGRHRRRRQTYFALALLEQGDADQPTDGFDGDHHHNSEDSSG